MERYLDRNFGKIEKTEIILFGIYIFLSFFETYLIGFIGNNTKFYLLFILAVYLYHARLKIRVNTYWVCYFIWFIYKILSLAWSNMSNTDFDAHVFSQIGIILLLVVVTGREQKLVFLHSILQINLWVSFLFGIMSIIFRGAFLDQTFVARQVLTLFGQQNDPNNCAAFLLVGITLGLYSAAVERKKILFNIVIICINIYALLLTSSRAGLLTLGAIVIVFTILPHPKECFRMRLIIKKLIVIAVLFLAILFIVQNYLPQANFERLFIWSGYEGGSGRDIRWEKAVKIFAEKPFFGWGWSGYNTGVGAIHNTFLTSLCDVGILGTILFTAPLLMISIESIRNKNMLAFLIMLAGVLPSFVLDAINKRFFWNAILISIMLILYQNETSEQITIWKTEDE